MSRERIIVAMSGGVDSSVAAGLLLREGYDVIGVTMRLWAPEDVQAPRHHKRCCSVEDIDDARSAADVLGIPHYVVNMEREFMANVVDYFVAEYSRGRTPNPCLPCNEHVKFRALVQRAKAMEARYLATGHYVRLVESQGVYRLYRARDEAKDQSYVLYMLGQEDLAGVRFPIGAFEKDEIRELAMEMGLPTASKPDSAYICFLPTEDYTDFIAERVPHAPGALVATDVHVYCRTGCAARRWSSATPLMGSRWKDRLKPVAEPARSHGERPGRCEAAPGAARHARQTSAGSRPGSSARLRASGPAAPPR